jgi:glutathione peroxidase
MPEQTIFDLTYVDNHGNSVSLDQFRGKPLLIVNTASKCGFTPQYEGLQQLHQSFKDRGLVVIGFPCDQFAHQEPGDDAQIAEFCQLNYGVTFPLAAKTDVNGKGTNAVFRFLKGRTRSVLGSRIKWNFTKFLVSADGETVTRYSPTTKPADLTADIERQLARS